MVQSIDRNDINLESLFNWKKEVELYDPAGSFLMKVYIRIVGDEDLNKAKVFGLRRSTELRRKLKTEDTDERLAYIPEKDLLDKETIVESLVLWGVREYTSRAVNEIKFNIPKEPGSKATLEDQEEYQRIMDNFPKEREKQIREFVTSLSELDRQKYLSMDFDSLYKEYELNLINQLCEAEMILRYREMCAFYGTYYDPEYKNRLFEEPEDFFNTSTHVKEQIIGAYLSLEINGEELKK